MSCIFRGIIPRGCDSPWLKIRLRCASPHGPNKLARVCVPPSLDPLHPGGSIASGALTTSFKDKDAFSEKMGRSEPGSIPRGRERVRSSWQGAGQPPGCVGRKASVQSASHPPILSLKAAFHGHWGLAQSRDSAPSPGDKKGQKPGGQALTRDCRGPRVKDGTRRLMIVLRVSARVYPPERGSGEMLAW